MEETMDALHEVLSQIILKSTCSSTLNIVLQVTSLSLPFLLLSRTFRCYLGCVSFLQHRLPNLPG